MRLGTWLGALSGLFVLYVAAPSWAQCSMDTDCKGDRVCEDGACTNPVLPAAAEAAPAAPPAAAPPAAAPPAAAPPPHPSDEASAPEDSRYDAPADEPKAKPKRHSTAMMVGGIVMVSVSPVALLASFVASVQQDTCEAGNGFGLDDTQAFDEPFSNCDRYDKTIYGGLILGVGLIGAGIPMIVIGAKREPAVARVSPWATRHSAGMRLQIDL